MKHTFLFTVIACLFTAQSWAAPTISSLTGTIGHNQLVTISGSGFGNKAQAAPQLWDTVDSQSAYSGLSDGSTIPTGGSNPWGENYNNSTKYESSETQRHSQSSACYKATGTNTHIGGKTIPGSSVYIAWWWKPVVASPWTDYSTKILRAGNTGDDLGKTFSWTGMHHYVWTSSQGYCMNYPTCGGSAAWGTWKGNLNQWNLNEVYIDGPGRTYKLYVNGSLLASESWACCSSFDFNYVGLIGYNGSGVGEPSCTSYIDDVYIDNTQARVLIGNASTFAASTHREIQIPSAWSDSSITIKVNQGSFVKDNTAYLYVVDANGAVNSSGYPITIESGAPAPSAPKGLHIVQ